MLRFKDSDKGLLSFLSKVCMHLLDDASSKAQVTIDYSQARWNINHAPPAAYLSREAIVHTICGKLCAKLKILSLASVFFRMCDGFAQNFSINSILEKSMLFVKLSEQRTEKIFLAYKNGEKVRSVDIFYKNGSCL